MVTMGFRLANQACVVIGGGKVAERRIGLLLADQARVTVISPKVTDRIRSWAVEGRLLLYEIHFTGEGTSASLLEGARFVVLATDDGNINQLGATLGRKLGAFVNRADAHDDCDFTFPATLVMGELIITIMTGRVSPRMNRLLKEDMAQRYEQVALVLPKIRKYRKEVKKLLTTAKERDEFWSRQLRAEELDLILRGEWKRVEEQIGDAISSIRLKSSKRTC
ncbi:bifunctional precorrin-2 dehydrogenase/sirohydrochlorin ferrochelatase [uncultured Veillonella sp.]|uniref:precorrin-2 dehydrogenase/sirohydrochlorin ferrochelatase family protein n=1 Tax=uncultured Veillonella sp. TaxID=159268 RepID=UPI0026334EA8|nr:bifunctional precorrin-2 dehydrogenase/sirohydrochlorin ferrochelatase [uncultured Veillonella sp.]